MTPEKLRGMIQDTLTPMGLYSRNAEELLMATAANESHLGEFRHQVGGPALGIFQEEPEDFTDIHENYLAYHPDLLKQVDGLSDSCLVEDLETNDAYAIAICRIHYERAPGDLPSATDLDAIYAYYKQFYNSDEGAATAAGFSACYRRYVLGQ